MTSFLKRVGRILLYAQVDKIVKKNQAVFDALAGKKKGGSKQ